MRILFVQMKPPWPIRSGQQLHAYNMMKSLAQLGHQVCLASTHPNEDLPALEERGWDFRILRPLSLESKEPHWMIRKWMNYWGIESWILHSAAEAAAEFKADCVVGVGLDILPVLAGIPNIPTIWYAADEWVLHYLSLFPSPRVYSRWQCLRNAAISFIYERSLLPYVRGVVVVSKDDAKAMKWIGGAKRVAIVPNGVDLEFYAPKQEAKRAPHSLIFWGRMDYSPNVEAVHWFYDKVFTGLKQKYAQAQLVIAGASPVESIQKLAQFPGVIVTGEVEDIRPYVWNASCVVIPVRTGKGIRNKLLEACAMGKAMVVSQQSISDFETGKDLLWLIGDSPANWIQQIEKIENQTDIRLELERNARLWVEHNYSWQKSAGQFEQFLMTFSADRGVHVSV